jgi:uncharacterized protein YbjQ (UPF0145 family)
MIISTTPTLETHRITRYHGIVTGEAILGANIFKRHSRHRRRALGGV